MLVYWLIAMGTTPEAAEKLNNQKEKDLLMILFYKLFLSEK
jgi:hypothetical protein